MIFNIINELNLFINQLKFQAHEKTSFMENEIEDYNDLIKILLSTLTYEKYLLLLKK